MTERAPPSPKPASEGLHPHTHTHTHLHTHTPSPSPYHPLHSPKTPPAVSPSASPVPSSSSSSSSSSPRHLHRTPTSDSHKHRHKKSSSSVTSADALLKKERKERREKKEHRSLRKGEKESSTGSLTGSSSNLDDESSESESFIETVSGSPSSSSLSPSPSQGSAGSEQPQNRARAAQQPAMTSTVNSWKQASGQVVPQGLKWTTEPLTWSFDGGRLVVQPLPKTNLHNAANGTNIANACFLHQSITGDFTFSSRIGGSLVSPGDAAAVTIWASPQQWAKICLQKGKGGEKRLVTVVTNPHSDEALGEIVKTANGFLRISRRGEEFVMHYAIDGKKWKLVRQFTWRGCPPELSVGVHAQSPSEAGQCMCEFADYSIVPLALSNFGQD